MSLFQNQHRLLVRQRAEVGNTLSYAGPRGEPAAGGCVLVSDSPNPRLGTPLYGALRQHCREPVDEVPSAANASDSHRPPSKHLRRGGSLQKASGPRGTYEPRSDHIPICLRQIPVFQSLQTSQTTFLTEAGKWGLLASKYPPTVLGHT